MLYEVITQIHDRTPREHAVLDDLRPGSAPGHSGHAPVVRLGLFSGEATLVEPDVDYGSRCHAQARTTLGVRLQRSSYNFV